MAILTREEIIELGKKAIPWIEECDTCPEENLSMFFDIVAIKFEELLFTALAYHNLIDKQPVPAWLLPTESREQ